MQQLGKFDKINKMKNDKNRGSNWTMWGVPLVSGTREEVLEKIEAKMIHKNKPVWVATVNPEFVMKTVSDKAFAEILMYQTDINVIDGIGLAWAKDIEIELSGRKGRLSKIAQGFKSGVKVLKGELKDQTFPGCDLMEELCRQASQKKETVFFLGGWNGAAKKTADYFIKKYPGLKVAGTLEGLVKDDPTTVLSQINSKRVKYLFISYGMKTQEDWIKMNINKLDVGLVMGVGRSMDYFSTQLKRAPKVWQKSGFEWLYSLIKQPRRWRRQMAIWQFLLKFLLAK